jgi:hypothetical protein
MSEVRAKLYADLLSHVARRVEVICANDPEWNFLIHHFYQSCFEMACQVLWQLNLAEAYESTEQKVRVEYRNGRGMMPPVFALLFRPETIRQRLDLLEVSNAPSLNFVLETFLRLTTTYAPEKEKPFHLSGSQAWFSPPSIYERSMELLAQNGYSEKRGTEFRWTQEVAPEMVRAHVWDDEWNVKWYEMP